MFGLHQPWSPVPSDHATGLVWVIGVLSCVRSHGLNPDVRRGWDGEHRLASGVKYTGRERELTCWAL